MKRQILSDSTYMKAKATRSMEMESKIVVTANWGSEEISSCLMGIEFQFCKINLWGLVTQQCEYT
jgi:hypothetical protein